MRIIRLSDLFEKPWKNGGGVTRAIASEILCERTLWQLSMADVEVDGPFSNFAGLTRVLTVIGGDGMILHGPDEDMTADFACPVVFDGGAPIVAELTNGTVRDFNLMYDTMRCEADVAALHGPADVLYGNPGTTCAIHCIANHVRLTGSYVLGAGDTVIVPDVQIRLELGSGDIALCIALRHRGQTDASSPDTALR